MNGFYNPFTGAAEENRQLVSSIKKADVAEHGLVFDHVGLLIS